MFRKSGRVGDLLFEKDLGTGLENCLLHFRCYDIMTLIKIREICKGSLALRSS